MLQRLKDHYVPEITSIEFKGEPVEPPTPIPWFPDQLAWQMTTPKSVVRRFPPFASFQKFLVSETSVGNISRQEAVSMIPPLVMDVQPGMTVLDLCAAPGSKAAQLIEMVHNGEESRLQEVLEKLKRGQARGASSDDGTLVNDLHGGTESESHVYADDGRTTGLLIANDVDYKRAHMLIHQMKRLNSPNLIVTNHDATIFPSIKLPSEWASEDGIPRGKYLKFDRILADVPCSGDGTCRKNINVWKDWIPGNALGLFHTQVRILVRALQMLKVGGRVVYSTCSMNPVENEAVIAGAIDRCGGLSIVNIIDCSEALPKLKRRHGLDIWKVMDKRGKIWNSWSEVEQQRSQNGDEGLGRLAEAMFPPIDQAERIPFGRCMRIYPHLQDTGAFFITVLEKKTEIKARPEAEPKNADLPSVPEKIESRPAKRIKAEETASDPVLQKAEDARPQKQIHQQPKKPPTQPFEEPFKYLDSDHEELKLIYSFYNLSSKFPRDRFMVRNASGNPVKTIYYTSTLARDVLTENEGKGIKFVHCGVKIFVKQDVQSVGVCKWRIQSEGLPILEGWVGDERVVRLTSRKTLRTLLLEMFPKVDGEGWQDLGEIGERVRDMEMGCCVLRVEPSEGEDGFGERLVLPLWRSLHSLNLMLPKEDRKAMLLRLYNDDSPLMDHSKDRFGMSSKLEAGDGPSDDDIARATTVPDVRMEEAGQEEIAKDDVFEANVAEEEEDEELGGHSG